MTADQTMQMRLMSLLKQHGVPVQLSKTTVPHILLHLRIDGVDHSGKKKTTGF